MLLSSASAETSNQAAVHLPILVRIFVFLYLVFELGFNDIDGSIHIERLFFDDDVLVRKMQDDFANTVVVFL